MSSVPRPESFTFDSPASGMTISGQFRPFFQEIEPADAAARRSEVIDRFEHGCDCEDPKNFRG